MREVFSIDRLRDKLKDESGFSILEVLISAGLVTVVATAVSTMIQSQVQETRAINERLTALDFQKSLSIALADGSVCNYVLNNPSVKTFDATKITANSPQDISLSASEPLYASYTKSTGTAGAVIAQVGKAPMSEAPNMVVNSIKLSIDGAPNPLPSPGAGINFTGKWLINFDSSKMVRAIKPVTVPALLTVDMTNPASATITGCQGNSNGSGSTMTCPDGQLMKGIRSDGSPECTESGQDIGSPCKAGSLSGITANGPYGSGKCCLIGYRAADIQNGGLYYAGCVPITTTTKTPKNRFNNVLNNMLGK